MANALGSTAFAPGHSDERALFCSNYKRGTTEQSRTDAIRHSPLVSLAVKDAVNDKKSTSQPSANSLANPQTRTLFGGTGPAGVSAGRPLFAASPSQNPQLNTDPLPLFAFGNSNAQLAASPSLKPQTTTTQPSLFAVGKPNPLLASNSKAATPAPTPNIFEAQYSASCASVGRAVSSQHKRQASSQNITAPSEGAAKVQKLDSHSSPSNGRLGSNSVPGQALAFGKENVKPSFSFSSLPPQAAASPATTSIFAAAPRTNLFPASGSSTSIFGAKTYTQAPEQPSIFGGHQKTVQPAQPVKSNLTLPQYGLLGFDLENCDTAGNPEPILLNTNSPSSVFLCGSQGSGKSYTLSCMLENHLLYDPSVGVQRQTIPGFVFHWDTNTSGSLAEAASLCSRGIKVRLLVSWSNYQQMKNLYESFAQKAGGKIEVRPLLFEDTELTVNHIRNLMAFRDGSHEAPLYLEVIQNILRRLGRKNEKFSVRNFFRDLYAANLNPGQLQMLNQRLTILKTFSAECAPDILMQDNKGLEGQKLVNERKKQGLGMKGDCITVEKGTLTIVDLSDPFVDASTACILFDICLGIILKRHKEAVTANKISPGLIISLDEAHKFLDKGIPSADIFTGSLLTTIREQRHNAARVIIATQEPTISEKLLDLCSVSIVHRFNSPAWFTAICGHLGGASTMTSEKDEVKNAAKKEELFKQILALQTGESLVFSLTSWVLGGALPGGGDAVEPARLGSGVLRMKTRERKGDDSGKTWNVV
jgi:hypothetical protein